MVISTATVTYLWIKQPSQAERDLRQVTATLKAVKKIYQVPDEIPVFATVSDKQLLAQQPFFESVENGDKVLIFNQAKKILLFRPSTNQIINFSSLNPDELTSVESLSPSPVPASTTTEPPSIAIYNGTKIAGLTQRVQDSLRQASVSGQVVARTNAAQTTYEKTLVVAVNPEKDAAAAVISSSLNASKVALPAGEKTPNADILIIVGQDQAQ